MSLLLNYAKETAACKSNLSTRSLDSQKVNEVELVKIPQQSITLKQETPSNNNIIGSGFNNPDSRKNHRSSISSYNNNCGHNERITFDNDQEFSERLTIIGKVKFSSLLII